MSGLLGFRSIGAIYSTYSRPKYSCNSPQSLAKAQKMCAEARARGDSFSERYGPSDHKYPSSSSKVYEVRESQITSGLFSEFDPCAVQRLVLCKKKPTKTTAPPPPSPVPVQVPQPVVEDPIVVVPTTTTPVVVEEDPVSVFEEEEPRVVLDPPDEEEDRSNYYVVGGLVALVVGGGLAYYLVTRKKKRKR